MGEHVELGLLLERYGALLTERQRELLALCVDEDLSLGEIAAQAGISRQGVRDAIKRAEAQLYAFEDSLGMEKLIRGLREKVRALAALPEIRPDGQAHALVCDIMEMIDNGV